MGVPTAAARGRTRPAPSRPLAEQAKARMPELVPVRWPRMMVSPFAFCRGANGCRLGGHSGYRPAMRVRADHRRTRPAMTRPGPPDWCSVRVPKPDPM